MTGGKHHADIGGGFGSYLVISRSTPLAYSLEAQRKAPYTPGTPEGMNSRASASSLEEPAFEIPTAPGSAIDQASLAINKSDSIRLPDAARWRPSAAPDIASRRFRPMLNGASFL